MEEPKGWLYSMPIYNYICGSCGYSFKAMHSIKDKLVECPECHTPELSRVPANFSLGKTEGTNNAGDLVKEKIEEFKSDLKQEKQKLASEDYEP
jgi:putative FmdB family regulatory protein|tara:strand:+ start:1027 stop:1308 length:282 start_codon:yes stop_codon:yes gene_type:complete